MKLFLLKNINNKKYKTYFRLNKNDYQNLIKTYKNNMKCKLLIYKININQIKNNYNKKNNVLMKNKKLEEELKII